MVIHSTCTALGPGGGQISLDSFFGKFGAKPYKKILKPIEKKQHMNNQSPEVKEI